MSIPDDLLEQIDAEAQRGSNGRSSLVVLAVRRELERREAIDAAIARSIERFRDAGPFDSGELIRAERDWRDQRDLNR